MIHNAPDSIRVDVADPARLATLEEFDGFDTAPEEGFDDALQIARLICRGPVALVGLVAADRQWFKVRASFPLRETDLKSSVCVYALSEPDLLAIPDLAADPRTRRNPLVTGAPHIRFYAGAPSRAADGQVLGSLCVIDQEPQPGGLSVDEADDRQAAGHAADATRVRQPPDRTRVGRDHRGAGGQPVLPGR